MSDMCRIDYGNGTSHQEISCAEIRFRSSVGNYVFVEDMGTYQNGTPIIALEYHDLLTPRDESHSDLVIYRATPRAHYTSCADVYFVSHKEKKAMCYAETTIPSQEGQESLSVVRRLYDWPDVRKVDGVYYYNANAEPINMWECQYEDGERHCHEASTTPWWWPF